MSRKWEIMDCDWAENDNRFPVREKEIQVKSKPDNQFERYGHVMEMIKKKEQSLKRLQNSLKNGERKKSITKKFWQQPENSPPQDGKRRNKVNLNLSIYL